MSHFSKDTVRPRSAHHPPLHARARSPLGEAQPLKPAETNVLHADGPPVPARCRGAGDRLRGTLRSRPCARRPGLLCAPTLHPPLDSDRAPRGSALRIVGSAVFRRDASRRPTPISRPAQTCFPSRFAGPGERPGPRAKLAQPPERAPAEHSHRESCTAAALLRNPSNCPELAAALACPREAGPTNPC